jgi:hypothetical protein
MRGVRHISEFGGWPTRQSSKHDSKRLLLDADILGVVSASNNHAKEIEEIESKASGGAAYGDCGKPYEGPTRRRARFEGGDVFPLGG